MNPLIKQVIGESDITLKPGLRPVEGNFQQAMRVMKENFIKARMARSQGVTPADVEADWQRVLPEINRALNSGSPALGVRRRTHEPGDVASYTHPEAP